MTIDDRMLKELGIEDVGALFADIPKGIRKNGIDLPDGLDERDVVRTVREMLSSGPELGNGSLLPRCRHL